MLLKPLLLSLLTLTVGELLILASELVFSVFAVFSV